jgi:uncharacterized sulfatase
MAESPNVLWITLDSVRTDHTTMGGYHRDTTPELQRITDMDSGGWYSECIAHSNTTRISTASIITGTYPSHHGVRRNRVLPAGLDTVPEILSREGYHTIGISRNANSSMGFDRGFDDFEWIASSTFLDAVDASTIVKYGLNIRRHSAGFTTDTAKHATPFIINDMAKRRIDRFEGRDQPFFMYLHYNEPHRPYYPPLPYLDRYTDDIAMSTEEAAEVAMEMHHNAHEIIAGGVDYTEEEWAALLAMYDAEIAYTDACVGRLVDHVRSLDLGDTVVVVTADHGELFGEHGLLTHKMVLHDALINVPLVTLGFEHVGVETDDIVQHADVMQTLVAMAGGDTAQFQGIDLRHETREYAVSQDWEIDHFIEEFQGYNPDFDASRYHTPLLTCLRDHDFKFQRSEEGSELFALPHEEADVADEHPEVAERMAAELEAWMERFGEPVSDGEEQEEFSDAMKDQLEDLGYLVD